MIRDVWKSVEEILRKGSKMPQFEVYKGKNGSWYWRLLSRNGRIIADGGQGYTRKEGALKGLNVVKSLAYHASVVVP